MQVQKEFIGWAKCQSRSSIYHSILISLLYLHKEYFVLKHSKIVGGKYVLLNKSDLNATYKCILPYNDTLNNRF